jgi:hemerythrin
MNGKFSGLDGIVQNFIHKSFILSNFSENIIFSTPQLQFMISALNNDIKDGFSIFQDAVYKIHLERARSSNIILISVFVCSLFFAVLSIFICFLPSKNILNNVELNTFRICQIDPSKDKGGKDVVLWNEQFSTDIERFDENHKKVLDYARKMYNVVDDARTTYLSYNANGRDNNDEVKDKNMGFEPFVMSKLIIPAVSRLVVVFFQTLYDEEKLMERYSITRQHIKKHDTQHLALVRKIYDASRHILHSKGNTNVILQIQTLTRTINDWIMSHTLNADRELGALLSGKASKTIMEDVNVDLLNFQVPKSFEVFMMSDEVSMPERESFEKFKKEILVFSKKL